jgi:signal transduction histidine kinase/DNA-binding response OmpR family regulator
MLLRRIAAMPDHALGNGHQADMRFLVDKNADGILVLDMDGFVLFANPAAEAIFGRRSQSLIGSDIGLPAIAGETTDIVIHRPGGDKLDVEIRAVETSWDERAALLVSLRDVSERRALEESLRHSAKMEGIGRLTAGIAHDFNNLLTVVIGNLDIARRAANNSTPAVVKPLDNAMLGAKRAAMLTERLLAFARRKPLDTVALIAGMSDMLRQTLGEHIVVQTIPAKGVLAVEADPTELEAAVLNLAVNARDAMPSGGHLIIQTVSVALPAGPDVAAGTYVLISVRDTGTGMSEDVLHQVFEPFFTTKQDGQGTGLGLSHVYGFARQSGGHVAIESRLGAGTTVKLYLPQLEDDAARIIPGAEATPALNGLSAGSGETLLVVEDNEEVRNYAASCLRQLGYRVLEACDGQSAVAIIDAEPDLALLLTDLGLPGGMNGQDIAQHLRQSRATVPVLLMTAYAASALVHDGRLDPGVELLSKPFTPSALAIRVHELLHHAPQRPHILVTEDEVMVRMFIVDTLHDAGCDVEEAGSGAEARAKFSATAQYDAAIIDLGLPDCRGDEVVAHIRTIDRNLPVILATGYAHPTLVESFKSDPRLLIVGKPFEPQQLEAALTRLGILLQKHHVAT